MGAPSADVWSVYILRCVDGSFDTGSTKDLGRRCRQHNEGTASRYTRSGRPVRLVYQEAHPDRGSALRREAAIKVLWHREKGGDHPPGKPEAVGRLRRWAFVRGRGLG